MPQISIIIPAHNEEKYISKTLQSLRQQNFLNYETIIVCNGCTDQTEQIARTYLNQSTKVISLEKANVGLARNTGAKEAKGDLFIFLDADTCLEQNALQKISQDFTDNVSVATTKTYPDNSKWKYRLSSALKNFYNQKGIYRGCSGVLVCRKNEFQVVGGYPELAVKEHRKLILQLKKFGKYQVIDTISTTSMRRFEQWGLVKVSYFWLKQGIKNYTSDLKEVCYEKVR